MYLLCTVRTHNTQELYCTTTPTVPSLFSSKHIFNTYYTFRVQPLISLLKLVPSLPKQLHAICMYVPPPP
jgi:hypothetical protein